MSIKRTLFPVLFIFFINSCAPRAFLLEHPRLVSIYFKHKISNLEKQSLGDLNSSRELMKTKVEFAFGILMEESDRLIDEDYDAGVEGYRAAYNVFKDAKLLGHKILTNKYPEFDTWLLGESKIQFNEKDIFDLFWYAAAIGGAVKSSRGNPFELIHLTKVEKLLKAAMTINPNWGNGALQSAMFSYTTSRNDLSNQALIDSANYYYFNAISASDSLDAGIFVSYAESIDKRFQQKDDFENKLEHVVNMNMGDSNSKFYMGNLVAKNRAKWLLSKKGDFFLE